MGFTQPMRSVRALAIAAATLLITSGFVVSDQINAAPAQAATDLVSSEALPTTQVNGVVWNQVVSGNTVYVGGEFTEAQPAGAAAGVGVVSRSNVLAYNLSTGELINSFAPVLNGQVRGLAVSPDGSRVYIVGNFTTVNGEKHNRIAALEAATGAPVAGFAPSLNSGALGIAVTPSAVYFGGQFTSVNGTGRTRAAAVNPNTGALLPWAPVISDYQVRAMVVSPDRSKVVLGGSFTSINGQTRPGRGLGAVDAVTGVSVSWDTGKLIQNGGKDAAIFSLSGDTSGVFATGYVYGSLADGNLEGSVYMDWNGGALKWLEDCHGDSYSIAARGDVVYKASHSYYCGNIGGFQRSDPTDFHRALAYTRDATGTVTRNTEGADFHYANFEGQPSPTLLDWNPRFSVGSYTGTDQAAWSVAVGGDYVLYGGEFTKVNGKRQTGLVRFKGTPLPVEAPTAPSIVEGVSAVAGVSTATVSWLAPSANGSNISRYTATSSPGGLTCTVPAATTSCAIPGLSNGTAYSFTVVAANSVGNSVASKPSAPVTPVTPTAPGAPAAPATPVDPAVDPAAPDGDTPTDVGGAPSRLSKPTATAASSTSARVSWAAPADGADASITGYLVTVYRGTKIVATVTASAKVDSIIVTGLKKSVTYRVSVSAKSAAGVSEPSAVTLIRPKKIVPPAATAVSRTSIKVSWRAPTATAGSAIAKYRVDVYGGDKVVKSVTVGASKRSVTISGLPKSTKLTVRVAAKNAGTYSLASAGSLVKPKAPSKPTATAASSTAIKVKWAAPSANGGTAIKSFVVKVYRSGKLVESVPAKKEARSLLVNGLKGDTKYSVSVTAKNSAGASAASSKDLVRTK